jgi:nitrate reductase alpha subunit
MMDCLAQATRMGWTPGHPGFDRNPLDLCDEAAAAGTSVPEHVVSELQAGRLKFALEDPDAPQNIPRVLTVWRANLIGNSAKGNEYFIKHLLGADSALRATEAPADRRPQDVTWREQAPEGKLDLLTNIDFRMTSTSLFSDIVLPAATWYEKQDISTTDMHPFVHALNAAITPPWQARTDHDAFAGLADKVAELGAVHLGTRTDVIAAPLTHDTPDEMAQPGGIVTPGIGSHSPAPPPRASPSSRTRPSRTSRRSTACGRTASPPAGRCSTPPRTSARRSSRCPARPTGTSPTRGSRCWSGGSASSCPTSRRRTATGR